MCISLAAARKSGAKGVLTVSSGNAAASLATYAASVGMDSLVLVDSGATLEKIAQIRVMGGRCILVDGLFEKGPEVLVDFIRRLCDGLEFWCAFSFAPINPYSQEGTKTIAYECAPLDPDVVICPVAGGDNLGGQWKGYKELHEAGLLDKRPRMVGVQVEGAAPLVRSFAGGKKTVETLEKAQGGPASLRTTFSGGHALSSIYESEGYALEVTDTMCRVDRERLAREEGVWVEGASASVIAAIPLLLSKGIITSDDRVLCIMTGSGYKEPIVIEESKDLLYAAMDSREVIEKYICDR
jgi:threonine synthase